MILTQMDKARHDAEIASKAAAVLALYMDALGELADDDVADTGAQRSALQTSIAGIPDVTPTEKAAAGALLAALDSALDGWRRHKIDGLIRQADPSVQLLTAYLTRVTRAVAAAEGAGARLGDAYWERSACHADEGTKSLLFEREAAEDAAIAALQARADAAAKVYARIGAGHAAMASNSGRLTGRALKAILRRDLPTLNNAAKAFEGSD
jgi:hypothetical protein